MIKKKLMLSFILLLLVTTVSLSGCIDKKVVTTCSPFIGEPPASKNYVFIVCSVSYQFTTYAGYDNWSVHFAFDTKKHDNFEDYKYFYNASHLSTKFFYYNFHIDELDAKEEYHYKGIVHYKPTNTWLQGEDVSFKI
jgi:hypothetical protein